MTIGSIIIGMIVVIFAATELRAAAGDRQVVEVAAICKGNGAKMQAHLNQLVTTMLSHSSGTDIKLILLSDEDSWPRANEIVRQAFGLHLTKGIIYGLNGGATITTEYEDLDNLVSTFIDQDLIKSMKRIFGPANKTFILQPDDPRRQSYYPDYEPEKALAIMLPKVFDRDLYYIAPFYHRLFPDKEKLIVVDLDMRFKVGLDQVNHLFSTMDSEQVVAFALDQSAHYPFMLGATNIQRQGVNCGLVLYKLKRMRESSAYNMELTSDRMEALSRQYLLQDDWTLAEQDWFSLLSWEQSHLVKILPCRFNVLRCTALAINSRSLLSKNFPCNEEPAILHMCGSNDDSQMV